MLTRWKPDWVVLLFLLTSLTANFTLLGKLHKSESEAQEYLSELASVTPLSNEMFSQITSPDAPSLGPENADTTLVVFSDFQCPFCKRLAATLKGVKSKNLKVIFRNFPLKRHRYAYSEATLGACVAAQDKRAFWDLHDFFFQNANADSDLTAAAQNYIIQRKEVNPSELNACLHNGVGTRLVDHDVELATESDVNATPTLFLNRFRVPSSVQSTDQLNFLIAKLQQDNLSSTAENGNH